MPRRAVKPTALKLLDGHTSHGQPSPERARANEPQPAIVAPRKPHDLDPDARYIWDQLRDPLIRLKLITEIDGPMFAALCQAAARQKQIRAAINAEDNSPSLKVTVTKFIGRDIQVDEEVINPLITLEIKNGDYLRKLAKEFGMTPTARAGLTINAGDDAADGEDLLD